MRIILVGIFVLIFVIFSLPLFLIEWIVGKFSMEAKQRSSLAIIQWVFKGILFLSASHRNRRRGLRASISECHSSLRPTSSWRNDG